MSEWIRIRVKDFYKDAVGELEYTYVTREVYEALADTFRKEAHAQEMRDIRHTTKDGYTEGETEDLVELTGESVFIGTGRSPCKITLIPITFNNNHIVILQGLIWLFIFRSVPLFCRYAEAFLHITS